MNTNKTAGQIAYDSFWNLTGSDDQWIKSHRKEWERSAAAVIAHHEASKDPFAECKSALSEGKIIQWAAERTTPTYWVDYRASYHAEPGRYSTIKWRVKPEWTIPTPPPGRSWHRDDGWTADMLPDGWRPLLMTELDGATHYDFERLNPEISDRFAGDGWVADPDEAKTCFYRTRRPLPPAHEVKITLQTIKLQTGKWSIASV